MPCITMNVMFVRCRKFKLANNTGYSPLSKVRGMIAVFYKLRGSGPPVPRVNGAHEVQNITIIMPSILTQNSVMDRTDDVSCPCKHGAQRYANPVHTLTGRTV